MVLIYVDRPKISFCSFKILYRFCYNWRCYPCKNTWVGSVFRVKGPTCSVIATIALKLCMVHSGDKWDSNTKCATKNMQEISCFATSLQQTDNFLRILMNTLPNVLFFSVSLFGLVNEIWDFKSFLGGFPVSCEYEALFMSKLFPIQVKQSRWMQVALPEHKSQICFNFDRKCAFETLWQVLSCIQGRPKIASWFLF